MLERDEDFLRRKKDFESKRAEMLHKGFVKHLDESEIIKQQEEELIIKEDLAGDMDRGYAEFLKKMNAVDYVTDEQKSKHKNIVKLLDTIVEESIGKKTTDIQISLLKDGECYVRYRIDGKMKVVRKVELEAFSALSCRIKLLCGLPISEAKIPLDGRFSVRFGENVYDIRVSTIPTNRGENLSLRLLYKTELKDDLATLNLRENVLRKYRDIIKTQEGMILLTGPTGSGKTTTLYTTIGELIDIYDGSKNIMTIEDPVEYEIDGIIQSQVNLLRNYDFSHGLRSLLRQNPDIILVGEIRDKITAETAVRASNTGHLVFSTLHANDAVSTIIVMKQLGVEPYNITNSLKMVVNQRLAGRLCDNCKRKRLLSKAERLKFPELTEGYESVGCKICEGKGTKGLVLLEEMLVVDDFFKEMVYKEMTALEMENSLLGRPTYYSLREDILYHLTQGQITIKDAMHFLKVS